jgi:hypothetical protein
VLSNQTDWVRPLLSGALALVVMAGLFGVVYRRTRPREMLPVHAHDEPPGSSHRHGDTGTLEHVAPDGR